MASVIPLYCNNGVTPLHMHLSGLLAGLSPPPRDVLTVVSGFLLAPSPPLTAIAVEIRTNWTPLVFNCLTLTITLLLSTFLSNHFQTKETWTLTSRRVHLSDPPKTVDLTLISVSLGQFLFPIRLPIMRDELSRNRRKFSVIFRILWSVGAEIEFQETPGMTPINKATTPSLPSEILNSTQIALVFA